MGEPHCPHCGRELIEVGQFTQYWCTLYECSSGSCPDYLLVADIRNVYPLQELQTGVKAKLFQADAELRQVAFSRIKHIDYKTVSIIFFEHTLLDCYRAESEYRVLYPDGSAA